MRDEGDTRPGVVSRQNIRPRGQPADGQSAALLKLPRKDLFSRPTRTYQDTAV